MDFANHETVLGIRVTADILREGKNPALAKFPDDFFFGLATAPTHVEDNLTDSWLEWAEEGHVAAWKNAGQPERSTPSLPSPHLRRAHIVLEGSLLALHPATF